nr:DUF4238 domain-containing protein [Sphingomonas xanthus]
MKHHYVPQFLLRRWSNANGKLYVFAMCNGRLVCSERAPEYTGFEHDLYAVIANAIGLSEDVLERKLFGPIDKNASKVLEKLEQHAPISEDEHIAWTFFLSSLRVRQPDVLDFLRTDGIARMKAFLAEFDQTTLPASSVTTEQWFAENLPGALEARSLTSWLPRMITHDEVTDAFAGLKWWFREFEPAEAKLLLADDPIYWDGGLRKAGFMIHLPIAPDRLFIGTRSEESETILSQMPAAELIRRVNRTTLASSVDRIWASTQDEARTFIEAHLDDIGKDARIFRSIAPWARSTAAPANGS